MKIPKHTEAETKELFSKMLEPLVATGLTVGEITHNNVLFFFDSYCRDVFYAHLKPAEKAHDKLTLKEVLELNAGGSTQTAPQGQSPQ